MSTTTHPARPARSLDAVHRDGSARESAERARLVRTAAWGGGLVTSAGALGAVVTHEGAQRTGELGLDVDLSQHRLSPLVHLAQGIDVGLGPVVGPLLVAVVALVLFVRHRRAAVVFAVTTAALWLGASATKVLFARHRPPAADVHALVHETAADSFPSGHTAFVTAVVAGAFFAARTLGHSGRRVVLVGAPAVAVVAVSRLYLGAHYLGDVVGSALLVGGLALLGTVAQAVVVRRRL